MATGPLETVLKQLHRVATRAGLDKLSDHQLLERFVHQRDELAFQTLVGRYGAMILGVCRRVLVLAEDVEDAFQATFVILARKAPSLRRGGSLRNWLYGVAYRTAAHAKVDAIKRRARAAKTPIRSPADPLAEITLRELLAAVDAELSTLPSQYQGPLLLCYLEGKTREEAAAELGWSTATLGRRLERGRELLRNRLRRRGVALPLALAPALLLQESSRAAILTKLSVPTVQAAINLTSGSRAATVTSARVVRLSEGVLRTMLTTKLKQALGVFLAVVLVGGGVGLVAGTQGLRNANEPTQQRSASPAVTVPGAGNDRGGVVLTHLTGVVRDAERKPISGATISLTGTMGYCETRQGSAGTGRGLSDAKGQYRLSFYTKPDAKVYVLGVKAAAKGYVQADLHFPRGKLVMKPSAMAALDIELGRGEVLAGVVSVPERLRDRLLGKKAGEEQHVFRVRSASFDQVLPTEPGGSFEVWVPRGVYRLELVTFAPPKGRGQETSWEPAGASLENVPSGSRNLKLEKVDRAITQEAAARAFDALWDDMALHYSYFDLKKIDWKQLKTKYRSRAVAAGTLPKFVDVLGEMLGELQDGHIWFVEPSDAVVAYWPEQRVSGDFQAAEETIAEAEWIGNGFARIGLTRADGFGVVRITRQSRADEASVRRIVEFIRTHAAAPGFLIDLRGADGGNEGLARLIAREFCAVPTVYARSKYRSGPKPTDFGPVYDRVLEPSDKPFLKPVVCILGPGCVSSGEGLAQMLVCLPNVTSVGLPTRGSSGNPKPFRLPGVPVQIAYSRWVDLMPDGQAIEGRGIQPQVLVDLPEKAFESRDPIWDKAMEILRKRAEESRRKEEKRRRS
jgi:RNA polymerase sigma factor (sigma-70 family)